MQLEDIRFPELKKQHLDILRERHRELRDRDNLTTVEKLEAFLAIGLVTAANGKKPLKTAPDAWSVIWNIIVLNPEWGNRDYEETTICFRVAATNVLKLIG